jgi:hypothetical protein
MPDTWELARYAFISLFVRWQQRVEGQDLQYSALGATDQSKNKFPSYQVIAMEKKAHSWIGTWMARADHGQHDSFFLTKANVPSMLSQDFWGWRCLGHRVQLDGTLYPMPQDSVLPLLVPSPKVIPMDFIDRFTSPLREIQGHGNVNEHCCKHKLHVYLSPHSCQ